MLGSSEYEEYGEVDEDKIDYSYEDDEYKNMVAMSIRKILSNI